MNVLVENSSLQDIADSIRAKLGVQTAYKPGEMADAIDSISGGGIVPTGTKTITENGTGIDVAQYALADVAVPNSYAAGDEGKVVSNGALVAQTAHEIVTSNGTIDTTMNNSVEVDVLSGGGTAPVTFSATAASTDATIEFDVGSFSLPEKYIFFVKSDVNAGDGSSIIIYSGYYSNQASATFVSRYYVFKANGTTDYYSNTPVLTVNDAKLSLKWNNSHKFKAGSTYTIQIYELDSTFFA